MRDGGRTALYRIFGGEDVLLYIGISKNFGARWSAHGRTQPWWPQVERRTIVWYDTWAEAKAEETAAIKAERPRYNIAEAHRNPWNAPRSDGRPRTAEPDPWANLRRATLQSVRQGRS